MTGVVLSFNQRGAAPKHGSNISQPTLLVNITARHFKLFIASHSSIVSLGNETDLFPKSIRNVHSAMFVYVYVTKGNIWDTEK